MQGEALSPSMFSLFTNDSKKVKNDLEKEKVANCCNSLELQDLNLF